jgi:hypothetical protein
MTGKLSTDKLLAALDELDVREATSSPPCWRAPRSFAAAAR